MPALPLNFHHSSSASRDIRAILQDQETFQIQHLSHQAPSGNPIDRRVDFLLHRFLHPAHMDQHTGDKDREDRKIRHRLRHFLFSRTSVSAIFRHRLYRWPHLLLHPQGKENALCFDAREAT